VLLFILSLTEKGSILYKHFPPPLYGSISNLCVCLFDISALSLSVHMFPEMDKAHINVTESALNWRGSSLLLNVRVGSLSIH